MSAILRDVVMAYAELWKISPFEILEKDFDDFILISRGVMEKKENDEKTKNPYSRIPDKNGRIKVNDLTATGGWF